MNTLWSAQAHSLVDLCTLFSSLVHSVVDSCLRCSRLVLLLGSSHAHCLVSTSVLSLSTCTLSCVDAYTIWCRLKHCPVSTRTLALSIGHFVSVLHFLGLCAVVGSSVWSPGVILSIQVAWIRVLTCLLNPVGVMGWRTISCGCILPCALVGCPLLVHLP